MYIAKIVCVNIIMILKCLDVTRDFVTTENTFLLNGRIF